MNPPDSNLHHSKPDHRKHYSSGTRASVEIDAETDEPQTKRRGGEFQEVVRDIMLEARAALEARLVAKGFTVKVKIINADCSAWFPSDVVEWEDERG